MTSDLIESGDENGGSVYLCLNEYFDLCRFPERDTIVNHQRFRRNLVAAREHLTFLLDQFGGSQAAAGFFRFESVKPTEIVISLNGSYRLELCPAGGWLLISLARSHESYWIPLSPVLRTIDSQGHILTERPVEFRNIEFDASGCTVTIDAPANVILDWISWRAPSDEATLGQIRELSVLETQSIFLWGSHTVYQKPADIYQHLIFGHVYENRYLWPYNRKSCSENDAHALYVTLCGLHWATRKELYRLLKEQVLFSVLNRQGTDGGWHHGEWSEDMEAHVRLNASAIRLLLDSLEERDDSVIRCALERGVAFLSCYRDETQLGTWLLHDSLELSKEAMTKSPFRWASSRVLGKSISNMLVLNTHLDSLLLFDRYEHVTGDQQYRNLVESGKKAAIALLNRRPLDPVFRLIIAAIRLTFLPVGEQRRLSIFLRAVKRAVGNWLMPNLYHLTARFPRVVMPGGYVERAVALQGVIDDYHSINIMDLVRYGRRFPAENVSSLIAEGVSFVKETRLDYHWGENRWKKYALGFWAEALYQWYLCEPSREKLIELAAVMLKLEDFGVGLPPSFLGSNIEVVPLREQVRCPSPSETCFRIANLTQDGRLTLLLINPTMTSQELIWEGEPVSLMWENSRGDPVETSRVRVPPREWVIGRSTVEKPNDNKKLYGRG